MDELMAVRQCCSGFPIFLSCNYLSVDRNMLIGQGMSECPEAAWSRSEVPRG
jgi:hypothetical protein